MRLAMRKILKKSLAVVLAAVVMSVTPLYDAMPSAAENVKSGGKYISDVRLVYGDSERAALNNAYNLQKKEGYTFLGGDNPYDLNKDAGTKSLLKKGANDRVVYMAYKTTDDPTEAITDMAVMNMNGGYSINDYYALLEKYMDSKVVPFLNNFINALEEYRDNYFKKGKNTPGHIRADYVRQMLNKLTDDDTGMPMGDLLLNKTRYEMGEKQLESLSEEEQKKHADILTILTQASGYATLTIETLITKASDSADTSWLERMGETTIDDMVEKLSEKNDDWDEEDIYKYLDSQYNDTAKKLLGEKDQNGKYMIWDSFSAKAKEYLEKIKKDEKEGTETIDKQFEKQTETTSKNIDQMNDDADYVLDVFVKVQDEDDVKEINEKLDNIDKAQGVVSDEATELQIASICNYLYAIDYDGKTLLDFFAQGSEKVSGKNNIRKLYPIVDALSAGQIAGLEFLSLIDLVTMAMTNVDEDDYGFDGKELYKDAYDMVKDAPTASIYEKVNRGLYEKGAVALTSQTKRWEAITTQMETDDSYKLGTLPTILWGVTAGVALSTAVTVGMYAHYAKVVEKPFTDAVRAGEKMDAALERATQAAQPKTKLLLVEINTVDTMEGESAQSASVIAKYSPSTLFKALTVGAALLTVVLIGVSTYFMLQDASKYFDTTFSPIPKYMVDEKDITDKNGDFVRNETAYYRVVECNRFKGNDPDGISQKNYEVLGTHGDLNGDIGKQWLALYVVKYKEGKPILADSLKYQFNDESVPKGYQTGIHEFSSTAACNLNSPLYLYEKSLVSDEKTPAIKVFFKTEPKTVLELVEDFDENASDTGSLFSKGYGIAVGGGILFIFLVVFVAVYGRRRRGKSE